MSGAISYTPSAGSSIERLGAPIWERIFAVSVRYIDTVPHELLVEMGVPTVGNRQLDQQMLNDQVPVFLTIDAMVEYYKRGVTVIFRNHAEIRDAYEIVNNYLIAWKLQVEQSLNLGKVPMDDLLVLDRWAESLYPVALKFGTAPRTGTSLFSNLLNRNGNSTSRDSLFQKPEEETKNNAAADAHTSHTPTLAKTLARMRSSWQ